MDRREFSAFSRRVLGRAGLFGVGYTARVRRAEVPAWERRYGAAPRGAGSRAELYPITYAEVRGAPTRAIGVDAGGEPVRRRTIALARDRGAARATTLVPLLGLASRGVVVYEPIYRGAGTPRATAARQDRLRGFAVGIFRLDVIVDEVLGQMPEGARRRVLRGDRVAFGEASPAGAQLRRLTILGRPWTVRVAAAAAAPGSALPLLVLVGGLGLTALTLALLVALHRREACAWWRGAWPSATAPSGRCAAPRRASASWPRRPPT